MSSYLAKPQEINRKWYIIDAQDKPLGRVAAQAASILRGKHLPTFTPNVDCGDHVIIINAAKTVLTGNKLTQKFYRTHTHYVGLKETSYKEIMAKKPEFAVYRAVKGMLPKNSLGSKMLKKLRVYKGSEHAHQAQNPEVLKLV